MSKKIIKNCKYCGKQIDHPKVFCDQHCHIEHKHYTLVNAWIEEPESFTLPRPFMKRWLKDTFGEKCSECGWNQVNETTGKIPIEFHHKDGNWRNNKPDNVCLLCPNCHSLTSTYRFGNRGNGREIQRKYYRGKTR